MDRNELLTETTRLLRNFTEGARVVATGAGMVLVERGYPGNDMWLIVDNGGEYNIERVNCPETIRPVAYTCWGAQLDPATMAYRVNMVLADGVIDYDFRFSADDIETLQSVGTGARVAA